eukprot:TRINITY_DN21921_c0_g1_i1.p1 TRINITY_DN21921_c0_g1~~TRINITY_DN21921_c0_g1_i1.p1  ORF type:complete len:263 (+),score=31.50 TRINITY_DN21921_c0_g1_i1:155-943(+)
MISNAEAFGMMDGAYFVSRTELLEWLNTVLSLSYSKVEQCCSGLAHLQLLDAMFPGKVALQKANFEAKLEHEYIINFKVLQGAFTANGIKKVIEIERLVKGKYQDNLEFLQWMKRFCDARMPKGPVNYDAVAVREAAIQQQKRIKSQRSIRSKHSAGLRKHPTTDKEAPTPVTVSEKEKDRRPNDDHKEQPQPDRSNPNTDQNKLEEVVSTLEAERDFYYDKLREIELLCLDESVQTIPKPALLSILYAASGSFGVPDPPDT